jgi:hypothetical protein
VDAFHHRLAAIGLRTAASHGFALAGGYAVNAHGFIQRPSNDVDLFTTIDTDLTGPTQQIVSAYRDAGLTVEIDYESQHYVRLTVADPTSSAASKVELVADLRLRQPILMEVGPVLHPDDVAGGKVEALFSRAEVRDFYGVNGATADRIRRRMAAWRDELLSASE